MNEKIRKLLQEVEAQKEIMDKCKHSFNYPFYNPENSMEAYGTKMVAMGSDVWWEPEGYRQVQKDRWTRVCSKCGFEQHTDKQKPIITGQEPDFK